MVRVLGCRNSLGGPTAREVRYQGHGSARCRLRRAQYDSRLQETSKPPACTRLPEVHYRHQHTGSCRVFHRNRPHARMSDTRESQPVAACCVGAERGAAMTTSWRSTRIVALLILVTAFSPACTTDETSRPESRDNTPTPASSAVPEPPVSSAATTASPPTGSTTPRGGTGDALEAYRQLMGAMVQASAESDPDFPLLATYATGEALVSLRYTLTVNRQNGLVAKGPMRMAPRVDSVAPDGNAVKIKDCLDDTEWLRYKADGTRQDGAAGGRRDTDADVIRVDGVWKVSTLRVAVTGTC